MGFVTSKENKFGNNDYYYVNSIRASKKHGGDGKVRKVWYYLGVNLEYLDYYFSEGIIGDYDKFCQDYSYIFLKNCGVTKDMYKLTFKENKLTVTSKDYDFRRRPLAETLKAVKHNLSIIKSSKFENRVNRILKLSDKAISLHSLQDKRISELSNYLNTFNFNYYTDLYSEYLDKMISWFYLYQAFPNPKLSCIFFGNIKNICYLLNEIKNLHDKHLTDYSETEEELLQYREACDHNLVAFQENIDSISKFIPPSVKNKYIETIKHRLLKKYLN